MADETRLRAGTMIGVLIPALAGAALLLSGCLAKTAFNVVTLPVKMVGKATNDAMTGPAETDREKKMRKAEERERRERRAHDEQCRKDRAACGPYTGFRADTQR